MDAAHESTLGASGHRGSSIECSGEPHCAQEVAEVPTGAGLAMRTARLMVSEATEAARAATAAAGIAAVTRRRRRREKVIRAFLGRRAGSARLRAGEADVATSYAPSGRAHPDRARTAPARLPRLELGLGFLGRVFGRRRWSGQGVFDGFGLSHSTCPGKDLELPAVGVFRQAIISGGCSRRRGARWRVREGAEIGGRGSGVQASLPG